MFIDDPSFAPIRVISVQALADMDMTQEEPQALILDLGRAQTYSRGHIPGAVHLPVSRIVRHEGYASGLMPVPEDLDALAMDFGLSDMEKVYLYDDEGGGWAGRMAWILDILGVPEIVYIDGGIRAWMRAGLPLDSVRHLPRPGSRPKALNDYPNVDLKEMLGIAGKGEPSVKIIDSRSQGEYVGTRQFAQRAGRIPGAIHFEWTDGINIDTDYAFKPREELINALRIKGIDEFDTVIVYCQTHHRSGLSYLMCRYLGFKVRAYAGSWSEWGNRLDTPVEIGGNEDEL